MSLEHLVEFLIKEDASVSRYHRAVRLFEFQVSLFYQRSFNQLLLAANDNAIAPTPKLREARALATVKILQKLENDIKEKSTATISIRDLAEDASYRSIFDNLFLVNSGWDQIVGSISQRTFDTKIQKHCELAQTAANIIDFSYRLSKNPLNVDYQRRRNPGGLDSARYVVRKTSRPAMADTTIRLRWSPYSSSAIFLYLLIKQDFDLKPSPVKSSDFICRLLRQTENREVLRRYFRAYQVVQAALSDLKYSVPRLELDMGQPPPELSSPVLSDEMKEAFSDWVRLGQ
jgi:hypothetical protein